MKDGSPQPIAQHLLKKFTSICFTFFLFAVLIFTVLAITYQPPDPWIEPGKAITKVLSSYTNATFKPDDSVVRTGEDLVTSVLDKATVADVEGPAISEKTVKDEESARLEVLPVQQCDPKQLTINCSDPGVLAAIVSHNLKNFSNLNFYAYQTPVRGAQEDECDVSWRFRAKKEKSWRMYRDFRRFSLRLDKFCNYTVVDTYGWHSGKNAKPLKFRRGGPFAGKLPKPHPAPAPIVTKNATVIEEVDVIMDTVPAQPTTEITFKDHKYLYYSRGGDHCKSMNQYLWSFLCALGEAQYLNRTFVVDLNVCLSGVNNPGHGDEDGKDFRYYFDFTRLKESASIIEEKQFIQEWTDWDNKHQGDRIRVAEINDYKIAPMQLQHDQSTIIWRKFEKPEPNNYWFRVCEGETEKVIQRPWHLVWKSKRIMDIVNAICGMMEWDFDAVHVVRGEKAKNKELWPNLDADTSVDSLVEKLRNQIDTNRFVYIATNEMEPGYFDTLKETYSQARTLDDFSVLWAENSLWYNQTLELTGGTPVEFDGYMRVEVDTEVTFRAKKKIETFGFLTSDCKNGINTC